MYEVPVNMKIAASIFLCALVLSGKDARSGKLVVKVEGARNAKGLIRVALWNQASGFPVDPRKALTGASAAVVDGEAVFSFEHIPAGSYAISSYHDENQNGKLDTNLVGIPKEEYGFSNGARAKIGPPSFAAARFSFDGTDATIQVRISMFTFDKPPLN